MADADLDALLEIEAEMDEAHDEAVEMGS